MSELGLTSVEEFSVCVSFCIHPFGRPCSSSFRIPITMSIFGTKLQLKSCIVQNEEKSSFMSLCPDGPLRHFHDEKVIKAGLFLRHFFLNCHRNELSQMWCFSHFSQ